MSSKAFSRVLASLLGFGLIMSQAATVSAQDQQKQKPKSSQQKAKEKEMDQKRQKAAQKIMNRMYEDGASKQDIEVQRKTNKKMFGHTGD